MMEAEMEDHLGYEKSCRSENDDYRNGYKTKTVKSSIGEIELDIPQNRVSTFEATKKWAQPLSNWAIAYGEMCIMYEDRLPD